MHKHLVNEAVLELILRPKGPILIKAGESGGLDPTHPDMEFVRTVGTESQVFLPGSSLKGVIRAHSERIVRFLQPDVTENGRGACDPLKRGASCSDRLERKRIESHEKYAQSCFICQLFGNNVVASRIRFADALPVGSVTLEERNGVAIDRVYGSVAVGPFNYEVVTQGDFHTRIVFKNFTLAQLALVGLALRDLGDGRVGLGFGKSRGLGRVTVEWGRLEVRYPMALIRKEPPGTDALLGVGTLMRLNEYTFPANDRVGLPDNLHFMDDGWGTLHMIAEGSAHVQAVFRAVVPRWREEVDHG